MKILIIRFSSIGDIILTTSVVRCLKSQIICEVHYLTKGSFANILENNPYVDKVHLLEDGLPLLISRFKKIGIDVAVDLHNNLRSRLVGWYLGGVPKLRYAKLNWYKWRLVNLKVAKKPRKLHVVDRYFSAVTRLEVVDDGKGLDYFFSQDFSFDYSLPNAYGVVAIGAAHNTKQMTDGFIIDLIRRADKPFVLIGGPSDIVKSEKIWSGLGDAQNRCINMVGKLDLDGSSWVVKNCNFLVTGDTGMMHIGAALGVKMYTVWGNTVPEFGMTPWYEEGKNKHSLHEVLGLACRPCSKIGFGKCPKGHFKCMKNQNLDKMLDLIF